MKTLQHKFVESIPASLEDDVLYISLEYCTAIHKCVCGCGNEVVTPISPTGWTMTFDGKSITLNPSIGSWNLKCQSHYFIINNKVKVARKWSEEKINAGKKADKKETENYYKSKKKKWFRKD